jgi:hypothetical protein
VWRRCPGPGPAVTAVARAAAVSTWLTYTPGIREHIEAARRRQHAATAPARPSDPHTALAAQRIELDLARQEIRQLRADRDRLSTAVRHQLGQQLDTLTAGDLTARVDELTQANQQLTDQLRHAAADNTALRASPPHKLISPWPAPACAA